MLKSAVSFRHATLAGACLALALASPLRAELSDAERDQRLAAIAEKASLLESDALKMQDALKLKKPDFEAVKSMLADVTQDIETLDLHIEQLAAESPNWASSSEAFAKMQNKAELLQIFASTKAHWLDSPHAKKHRKLLAAKAKGIALRAEMLRDYATVDGD